MTVTACHHHRRRGTWAALAVVGLLAAAAGCSSSTSGGAAGLDTVTSTASTGGTPATTAATTAPATHTPAPASTTKKAAPPPPSWPTPEDCVSYNPRNLTVTHDTDAAIYVISDGSTVVMRLYQPDAAGQEGLALAQRYSRHCYIGRNNTRGEDRGDYIFDYWRGTSGSTPAIPNEDDLCSPYNNKNLTVEDMGDGNGWRVKDHDHVLHEFDNKTDAINGDLVIKKYSQICYIGNADDNNSELGQVDYLK